MNMPIGQFYEIDVDNKIPFYRLNVAAADLEREFDGNFLEYQFKWSDVRNTFKTCQLYDYDATTWYRFKDEPTVTASDRPGGPAAP